MMDEMLGNLLNECVIVYLDDILVYADSIGELKRSRQVFERLASANLKMRARKCYIGHTSIEYLGYMVSDKRIFADKKKVNAINSCRLPKTLRQLRRFIGMCSCYRNFIPQFSHTAKSLFDWTKTQCDKVVFQHPDYNLPFVIFTDASKYGVGAVLKQNGRPLWFAPRSFGAEL